MFHKLGLKFSANSVEYSSSGLKSLGVLVFKSEDIKDAQGKRKLSGIAL